MSHDSDRNAVAQVIHYEPPPVDRSRHAELVELDVPVSALHRRRGWRQKLRKAIEVQGRKVLAINVLAKSRTGAAPHDVVITVQEGHPGRPRRLKPVTRGGRSIDGPIPVRTMATRRRGG